MYLNDGCILAVRSASLSTCVLFRLLASDKQDHQSNSNQFDCVIPPVEFEFELDRVIRESRSKQPEKYGICIVE